MLLRTALAVLFLGALSAAAGAQETATVVPGERYEAGGLHRWLFGSRYRELWTAPVEAPVLDLATFAGGLTPTGTGGGKQTLALRFKGADGRPYTFRALDKDPSETLPEDLRETSVADLYQDQISSSFPTGHVVVPPLLDAVGVLHVTPRLVILPDDPALGEYREAFAGQMGMIEEYANEGPEGAPGFAGATDVKNTTELFDALASDQRQRVNATKYLTARLIDLLIGDWDRHRGQWRWANVGEGDPPMWEPIPEDRDQAFVRYDGLVLAIARDPAPQLLNFGKGYAGMLGATWNGRDVDRRILVGLERAAWDSVAEFVVQSLTNDVIDDGVNQLPIAHLNLAGVELATALKARRDKLPEAAASFYRHLAEEVDIHGTDHAETVDVVHEKDGVRVVVRSANGVPALVRRFSDDESDEVRLYLHGGDDVVNVGGEADSHILVRVIGDEGEDRVEDATESTRVYDAAGGMTAEGLGVKRRLFAPDTVLDEPAPRDWGSRLRGRGAVGGNSDIGFFLALGVLQSDYGFRKLPEARNMRFSAGYATGKQSGRVRLETRWHQENSRAYRSLEIFVSGIEILRFHGFGNEAPELELDDLSKVEQTQGLFLPSYHLPLGASAMLIPKFSLAVASTEDDSSLVGQLDPYGSGTFGQVGLHLGLEFDTRDEELAPSRGIHFMLEGGLHPGVLDVEETFQTLEGEMSTYLSPWSRLTLALRAGGKKIWGDFPFQNAAYLGGASTVRGFQQNRFAGDASLYGTAELRWSLTRFFLLLPNQLGLLALVDTGRVYLEGEESTKWHSGIGGGIWLAPRFRENATVFTVASSKEGTRMYLQIGFGF